MCLGAGSGCAVVGGVGWGGGGGGLGWGGGGERSWRRTADDSVYHQIILSGDVIVRLIRHGGGEESPKSPAETHHTFDPCCSQQQSCARCPVISPGMSTDPDVIMGYPASRSSVKLNELPIVYCLIL